MQTLNVKAAGFTCGLLWGATLFVVAWWIMMFDGATGDTLVIGEIYRGYNVSPLGSLIGLIWGLVDGFIGGVITAWLYNFFAKKFAAV